MNNHLIYMRDPTNGYTVTLPMGSDAPSYAVQAMGERLAASLGLQYTHYLIMPS